MHGNVICCEIAQCTSMLHVRLVQGKDTQMADELPGCFPQVVLVQEFADAGDLFTLLHR